MRFFLIFLFCCSCCAFCMKEICHGSALNTDLYTVPGKVNVFTFSSPFCGPCRAISAKLEKLSSSCDCVNILKVNINYPEFRSGINWTSEVALQFGLKSIPWNMIIDESEKVFTGEEADRLLASLLVPVDIQELSELIDKNPCDVNLLYERGKLFLNQNRLSEAACDFRQISKLMPYRFEGAYYNEACALAKSGETKRAVLVLKTALMVASAGGNRKLLEKFSHDPDFNSLRYEPEFIRLLMKYRAFYQ